MKDLIQKLLLVTCFGFSLSTNASLIGDNVDCATSGVGIACSSTTATVGDGLEFTIDDSKFGPRIDLDIGASSISIRLSESNSFNNTGFGNRAFNLSSLDWVGCRRQGKLVFDTWRLAGFAAARPDISPGGK